jgi:hypothetical protein
MTLKLKLVRSNKNKHKHACVRDFSTLQTKVLILFRFIMNTRLVGWTYPTVHRATARLASIRCSVREVLKLLRQRSEVTVAWAYSSVEENKKFLENSGTEPYGPSKQSFWGPRTIISAAVCWQGQWWRLSSRQNALVAYLNGRLL